jgi:dihydrolipoamide dehydrogenase
MRIINKMNNNIEVRVPAIGGRVAVVEVLVAPGDRVLKDQALVTLQGDKGAVGVAAPASGTLIGIQVKAGDGVAEGDLLLVLNAEVAGDTAVTEIATEVVVLGAGPGGYTAAFRAADLGKQVVLIERYRVWGASASMSVASLPRPCSMPPRSSTRRRRWRTWACVSANRTSIWTRCGQVRIRWCKS